MFSRHSQKHTKTQTRQCITGRRFGSGGDKTLQKNPPALFHRLKTQLTFITFQHLQSQFSQTQSRVQTTLCLQRQLLKVMQ